jgi:sugar phosphate permease
MVATFCVVYMLSHFLRGSVAVIAPDLTHELGLSPEALAALAGAFFIAFAAAQIPLGVLLDRFGPRRVVPATLLLAAAGSALFAVGSSALELTLARVLMGLGSSAVLMGSMVVCARWFAPERYGAMAAIVIAVGTLGNSLATTPLGWAAETLGWRGAFVALAAVGLGFAAWYWLAVRDAPPGHALHARQPERAGEIFRGVAEVLRNRDLPYVFVAHLVAYPSAMCILGLWGGPYLYDVHGLDAVGRGHVLLAMTFGVVLGTLVLGPLDRVFDTRKWLVALPLAGVVAILGALALLPQPPLWLVAMLFAALAFCANPTAVIMAHGRAVFPDRLVGRGITTLNMALVLGTFLLQTATGPIVGAFVRPDGTAPEIAYRWVFGFLAAVVAAALLFYLRVEDAKPSRDRLAAGR